jgi:hypothetical protein
LLYVFNMGRNQFRAQLNVGAEDLAAYHKFDEAASRLSAAGGGVISIYYHPTEFVTTQFWDAPNFSKGANPDPSAWVKPHRRTPEDSERCFRVLQQFVRHMKSRAGVRFVTAEDLGAMFQPAVPASVDRKLAAERLSRGIVFGEVGGQMLSPADMLLALMSVEPQVVDGPTAPGTSTYTKAGIPAGAFRRSVADAAGFVRAFHRLPNEVFVGAETLSLTDFAATLAANLDNRDDLTVARGKIEFERYFSTDGHRSFDWVIHPEGFDGSKLLDLGRLQGWTLKPARLKSAASAAPR